jgi:hypothetical protein
MNALQLASIRDVVELLPAVLAGACIIAVVVPLAAIVLSAAWRMLWR